MYYKAADMRLLIGWPWVLVGISLLTGVILSFVPAGKGQLVEVAQDRTSLFYRQKVERGSVVTLRAALGEGEVLGRVIWADECIKFIPVVPLIAGSRYRLEIENQKGVRREIEFSVPAENGRVPTVTLLPQAVLPANALKLYLHFSEPMEQGIFLERLRLLDDQGTEVAGPFRETELWSPDGRRLTVWLHPGRQKTGVNLNLEEGPVLKEGKRYTLEVDRRWRSTEGLPLEMDKRFTIETGPADHKMPSIARWTIQPPKAATTNALVVHFDEPLDTAMLKSALEVWRDGKMLNLQTKVDESGSQWSCVPDAPWQAGHYELRANPLLEDLAGNNLLKPFEEEAEADSLAELNPIRLFEIAE